MDDSSASGMIGPHHAYRRALVQAVQGQMRTIQRHRGHHHVVRAVQQAFPKILAAHRLHIDMDVGIALREFLHGPGQHAQPQRWRASQPQHPAAAAPHCRHPVFDAFQAHEMALDGIEQILGFTRGPQTAALHVEQPQAAGLLCLRQQAADGRLGGAQHLRGSGRGASPALPRGRLRSDGNSAVGSWDHRVWQSCIGYDEKRIFSNTVRLLHSVFQGCRQTRPATIQLFGEIP